MLQSINLLFILLYFINPKFFFNINSVTTLSNYWSISEFIYLFYLFPLFKYDIFSNYNIFINTSLTNVLAFYHPILLYTYLIYLLFQLFDCCYFLSNYTKYYYASNYRYVIFSFILSSWWSSQEIFWNGFWNWDMVEISLLNFIIIVFFFSHCRVKIINFFLEENIKLVAILFFFFSNKTNLIFSQHSFSSSFLFKLDIIIITILFIYIFRKLLFFIINFRSVLNLYFFIFIFIFLYYSFYKYFYSVKVSELFVRYTYQSFMFIFLFKYNFFCFFNLQYLLLSNTFLYKFKKNFLKNSEHLLFYIICVLMWGFYFSYNYILDTFFNQSSFSLIVNFFFFDGFSIKYTNNNLTFFNVYIYKYLFFFFKNEYLNFAYVTSLYMMVYLNKIKIQKKIKRFKKRRIVGVSYNKNNFNINSNKSRMASWSFVFSRLSMFLELKFYRFFIFKLRRMSRKRKFKSYVNMSCNHCFSKKSKNSRMGKGKGKFVRYVYRTVTLKPIFSFFKMSKIRVCKFVMFLNKKSLNKFWFF